MQKYSSEEQLQQQKGMSHLDTQMQMVRGPSLQQHLNWLSLIRPSIWGSSGPKGTSTSPDSLSSSAWSSRDSSASSLPTQGCRYRNVLLLCVETLLSRWHLHRSQIKIIFSQFEFLKLIFVLFRFLYFFYWTQWLSNFRQTPKVKYQYQ